MAIGSFLYDILWDTRNTAFREVNLWVLVDPGSDTQNEL